MRNAKRKPKIIVIRLGTNDIQYSATPISQAEVDEKIAEVRKVYADTIARTALPSKIDENGVATVEIPCQCDERGNLIKLISGDHGVIGAVNPEHRPVQTVKTALQTVTTVDEFGISVSTEGAGQASGFFGQYRAE
jgi:hypothetical protein